MYRIIGADGNQYGPISAEQLRQWIAEGRANAQTKVLAEGTTEWKPLSEFPEFFGPAAPPPGATTPPPPAPGMPTMPTMQPLGGYPVSAASDQVNGPAIGLIILGALNIVLALANGARAMLGAGMSSIQSSGNPDADKVLAFFSTFGLGIAIVGLLGGIFILFGGIKMRSLESYGLCMAASILAMIPCLSVCCPAGLAIGIWSLVILSKPEVKSAFH